MRESLVSHAAPPGANVCFAHWRARLEARPPPPFELVPPPAAPGPPPAGLVPLDVAPAGVSGVVLESPPAASQGAAVQPVDITPTAQTYYVEAVDVAFYSDAGLISDVYQFRTPVGWERRHVLD